MQNLHTVYINNILCKEIDIQKKIIRQRINNFAYLNGEKNSIVSKSFIKLFSVAQAELVCAWQVDNQSFILISPFRHATDKINNFDTSIFFSNRQSR